MQKEKEIFVGTDNQTLLWTLIKTCPAFHYLYQVENPAPELWFASIIEKVYESDMAIIESLMNLNKRALYLMLDDLAKLHKQRQTVMQKERKQRHLDKQVEEQENERIQQMSMRVDKDIRKAAIKDEPIKNMEELILEQQKLRELDLPKLPPPQGEKVDI